jgi:hypothetical protein
MVVVWPFGPVRERRLALEEWMIMSDGAGWRDPLAESLIDVHGSYRSQRLRHEPPDERISDAVTWATLKPHVIRSSLFYLAFLIILPVWVFSVFAASVSSKVNAVTGKPVQPNGFLSLLSALTSLMIFALAVAWVIALFLPLREPIAEYGLLIEGRAGSATSAYGWIMSTVQRRRAPFDLRVGKVIGVPTLQLTSGRVRALVVVRTVGVDLYIGWTMWRGRSAVVLIGNQLRDTFRGLSEPSNIAVDLRGSNARALRELVHSLTREGIQAALLQVELAPAVQQQIDTLPNLDSMVSALRSTPSPD